jgi:hypothetical protein
MSRLAIAFLTPARPARPNAVVLVKDRDPGNAEIVGQVLDPGFGLLKIRAANIDDIAVERIAKKFSAGERADERHLCRCCDGLAGLRGGRSDRADEGKDLVFLDGIVGRDDRLLGLVAVVDRFKLELAAIDAAGVESGKDAFAHALAEGLRRAVKRGDLPKNDSFLEHAVLGAQGRIAKGQKGSPDKAGPAALDTQRASPHKQCV